MATQSVLPFTCRKPRVLSPKIMNLENSPAKSNYSVPGGKNEYKLSRSVMMQPKSPRKWFAERTNLAERWTQEDLLNEIFRLSPRSPIKPKKDCPALNIPDSTKTPRKRLTDKNGLMSPTRTLLSPIRSLSLKSPERTGDGSGLKRSKILQLKLQKISVSDSKSPVKLPPDDRPIHCEEDITGYTPKDACQIIGEKTPKKVLRVPDKRITRSARKLRCQRNMQDGVQDDFKENVPPGCCPTPSKMKKPSPEPKKAQATPKSQRSKKRVARKLDVNTTPKVVSPKKLDFNTASSTPTSSPQKELNCEKPVIALHKPNSLQYQLTKHALHSSLPDELVGRKQEMKTITDFVCSRISSKKSGSLYISGAPGTGKSACASKILSSKEITEHAQVITINCMSSKNATAIYSKIASEMGAKPSACKTVKSSVSYLEMALTSNVRPVVLLLDEMDQLSCKNQEVLYTMFEWPALPNSRLILIGIANTLDLTDRILPRLQTRKNCQPDLLNFRPYSKDQLVSILEDRVKKMTTAEERVIDPKAIQFCARKVSAVTGDARKALDICRRAVEVVETSVKSQQVLCNPATIDGLPGKVRLKEIARVFSEVYESSLNHTKSCGSSVEEESFPLQQKLTICTLILLSRQIERKEVTVGKLHEAYSKVCKKRQVTALGQSELLSMLHLIETRGIVSMKAAKQTRMTKVALALQEKDVEHALCDKMLLSVILQEGLPE